jgi:hypothetical protein
MAGGDFTLLMYPDATVLLTCPICRWSRRGQAVVEDDGTTYIPRADARAAAAEHRAVGYACTNLDAAVPGWMVAEEEPDDD